MGALEMGLWVRVPETGDWVIGWEWLDITLGFVLNIVNVFRRAVQCCGRIQNDKVLRVQLGTFVVWSTPFGVEYTHLSSLIYVDIVCCFSVKQGGLS
jgi:hypothetical protein